MQDDERHGRFDRDQFPGLADLVEVRPEQGDQNADRDQRPKHSAHDLGALEFALRRRHSAQVKFFRLLGSLHVDLTVSG